MKKFLSVLLVAVMVLSMASVAFAAGAGNVSIGTATAEPGDTVTLNVTVSGEFANYEMYISVADGLKITAFNGIVGNIDNGKVAFASAENVSSHSFSVTIAVGADLGPGFYPVSGTVDFVSDRDLVDLEVSVSNGGITIEAEPETEHVHAWGEWKQTKAPDCVNKGEEVRTCATCGETESRPIPALGHNWLDGEWKQSSTHHWHACSRCDVVCEHYGEHDGTWQITKRPTKTEPGKRKLICKVCEYVMAEEVLPAEPDLPDEPTPGKFDFALINGAVASMMVLSAAAFVILKRKAVK